MPGRRAGSPAERGRGVASEAEILFGLHPILEAIESGRRTIERILVAREGGGAGLGRLLRLAREGGVPVTHVPREALARKAGRGAVHQGVAAIVSAMPYADAEALCREAVGDPEALLVVLEGVEDPRNLGAVVRTAAAAGASGVLVPAERSVGLTPAVAKASAGALERIGVAREPRLRRRLESLREAGFRLLALESSGDRSWDRLDLSGRNVVVAGGEGRGLRPELGALCSHRISIPLERGVESLNVSVAVAVVLYEIVRQRRGRQGGPKGR